MNDSEKWDGLLRQALAPAAEPEEELNETIINRYKERNRMKRVNSKRISIGVLIAVCTLVLSFTAVAAAQLFSSKQVAQHLGDQVLAQAFESRDAIEINQSVASGDYNITLHGIVSGAGLSGLNSSAQDINPERTYAVVSIAKQNGSPMPATSDPEYGQEPFFISPFIKGQKPWQVNIITMNGGYSEVVVDGTMYRLIECDDVEMFADRGVYLAVSSGDTFFNNKAYAYNEATGEISPRTDYKGTAILFDLPLNKAKADTVKAEAYLKELLPEPTSAAAADPAAPAAPVDDTEAAMVKRIEEWKSKLSSGTVIPESVKEVTYDDEGRINYSYEGWSVKISPEQLFAEGQTGYSEAVNFSGDDTRMMALQFSRDDKGVITGRVIKLK